MARLFLIFVAGLVLAHAMSFTLLFYERYQATRSMMLGDLERDVAVAFDVLDRLPADERAAWLSRLSHDNRQYRLGPAQADQVLTLPEALSAAHAIELALQDKRPLSIRAMAGDARHIQAQVTLADGSLATLDLHLRMPPLARWIPLVLALQLLLLVVCAWLAVRLAVRPLTRLARAADAIDLDREPTPLAETGPSEVAQASAAFNAMQARIASHLAERMRMLGAISHDLQTPITRMKLRTEFMDDTPEKEKFENDLTEVQRLVREGLDYARSAHGNLEIPARVDLPALLDSLVCDYQDTGREVTLSGTCDSPLLTRPHALRRVLGNLIDNALKFAGSAELRIESRGPQDVSIHVLDRGPGIPQGELDAVLQPFYRVEGSRNRDTGGTGLGLAIARQLATVIGAQLLLSHRAGGGLAVEVRIGALPDA
ncbi:ATP-binding protein [Pseudomonadota bacterium AL_CKDN230030165-1A_HGKHYDSX7]